MSKKSFIWIISIFITVVYSMDVLISDFLKRGLHKYYGIGQSNEIALLGHSHLMLGVDKPHLQEALDLGVSKYTREGVNVHDRLIMVKQLLSNDTALKTMIYGVDPWLFTGEGLSENSYNLFYPFLDDSEIEDYVRDKSGGLEYYTRKFISTSRYNEQLLVGAIRGHLGNWSNLKYGEIDTIKLNKELDSGTYRRINNSEENIRIFEETLTLLRQNRVVVILVNLPVIDKLRFVQKEEYNRTMNILRNLTSDSVYFVDFQEPWSHRYDLFYDPIHLNPIGQSMVTNELIKYLSLHYKEMKY